MRLLMGVLLGGSAVWAYFRASRAYRQLVNEMEYLDFEDSDEADLVGAT